MESSNDLFFSENRITVNKLVEKILLTTLIVPIAFMILTFFGIWQVPHNYSLLMVGVSITFYLISHFLNINPANSKFSMYWGLFGCATFVELLAVKNIISVNITYCVAPFISTIYYNKKLTFITTLTSFALMIISFFFKMNGIIEHVYARNARVWTDSDWLISALSGYGVEYIFVFMVAFIITKTTHRSMNKIIDTSNELDKANEKLVQQNEELHETQGRIIQFIADILGSHDLFTGRHVMHTQAYVKIIALELRSKGNYKDILTNEAINSYKTAAFLHDIGKIHIPEGILNKPGKFTEQEFELMKCHPAEGLKLLEVLPLIDNGKFNEIAKQMAYSHHEKWNGTGYPEGLKGEEIPLCARIMAAADVLDALISKRLYKDPMSIDEAMNIFEESKGTHFEPCIAEAVINCRDKIVEISNQFKKDEIESEEKEVEWWNNYHANLKK